ncbi:MAG: sigma-70 family RNA polymerase sigma factor [Limnochordaceae bacterium]|nr:sigma-70 family RNA polymerase sigma factor [Limnochordaceae bacterium]
MASLEDPLEAAVVLQAQAGDESARETLVQRFLPLCRRLARRYRRHHLDAEDLVQEACLGLLAAIDGYEPAYQVRFSSFAYLCIQRHLLNVLKQSRSGRERAAQEAISLFLPAGPDDEQHLWETLPVQADPADLVTERWAAEEIRQRLGRQLSELEWAVTQLSLAGYSSGEMQRLLCLPAKVIDNAHTRVRRKLLQILQRYGSLLAEQWRPGRRRYDLCYQLPGGHTVAGRSPAPPGPYPWIPRPCLPARPRPW